jgi:mono/diheme cytochrome c family protein
MINQAGQRFRLLIFSRHSSLYGPTAFSLQRKVQAPRIFPCSLLMLGTLLAVGFPVAAASNGPTTIEFKQGDKNAKVLSLDEIRAVAPPVLLKVFEVHENKERVYKAFPVRPVLDHIFGKEWEQAQEIVFTSIDGYQPSVPVAKFLAHPAFFAFAHADNSPFKMTNTLQNNEIVQLGPLYLVWDNLNSKALLESGASDMPYQIKRIEIRSEAPFPSILPPANASPEVKRGYMHFRQHCIACHTINGEGGGKAPELNYPVSVVEYIKPEYLKRWVMSPQSIRYNTLMPALSRGIPNAEQVTEELITYLKVMSIMKREPARP